MFCSQHPERDVSSTGRSAAGAAPEEPEGPYGFWSVYFCCFSALWEDLHLVVPFPLLYTLLSADTFFSHPFLEPTSTIKKCK